MRQQDAFEFLLHVFKSVSLSKHSAGQVNPVQRFRFEVEQRLQCLGCRKVSYKVDEQDNVSVAVPVRRVQDAEGSFESVTLSECLDIFTAEETVELSCPVCDNREGFLKRSSFKTLPHELVVNARRFELVNWVPTKLDIPVIVHDEPLDFGRYLAAEHDADEDILPDVEETTTFEANAMALDQLLSMGFPAARCEKALHATGNSDPEAAMNWLFAHMEDADIDEPLVLGSAAGGSPAGEQDDSKVAQLGEMGIEAARARRALAATDGDVNRALDWVFSHPDDDLVDEGSTGDAGAHPAPSGYDSLPARYQLQSIVCHKGTSVHAGFVALFTFPCLVANLEFRHYVAFIRKSLPGQDGLSWVMFNDEKVVRSEEIERMKSTAYMYFFSRV